MTRSSNRSVVAGLQIVSAVGLIAAQGCMTGGSRDSARIEPTPVQETAPMPRVFEGEPEDVALRPAPRVTWTPSSSAAREDTIGYTVKKGDCLSTIAAQYGVRVSEITEINAVKTSDILRPGQVLQLPAHAKKRPVALRPRASSASRRPAGDRATETVKMADGSDVYTIRSGDTLGGIASRFKVTVEDLRSANNMTGDRIIAGRRLVIPPAGGAKVSDAVAAPVIPVEATVTGAVPVSASNALPNSATPIPPAAGSAPAPASPAAVSSATGTVWK
jgi:LysM repeat protein